MKSNAANITVVYKYITIFFVFLRIWGGGSLFNCHNAKKIGFFVMQNIISYIGLAMLA